MPGDLSILYVLMGVVILFALLAAIGAWARGGGLKREEIENLFAQSQTRQSSEIDQLKSVIEETRTATQESQSKTQSVLSGRLHELDGQITRTRTDMEAAVLRASTENSEALSEELELVTRRINDTERRVTETLQRLENQVTKAGEEMRAVLLEVTRQQQDQKAQSSIQMCEALINSLGTLKSNLADQLNRQHNPDRTLDVQFEEADEAHALETGHSHEETPAPETAVTEESAPASDTPDESVSIPSDERETVMDDAQSDAETERENDEDSAPTSFS